MILMKEISAIFNGVKTGGKINADIGSERRIKTGILIIIRFFKERICLLCKNFILTLHIIRLK
jgi:hypothetical protein